MNPFSSAIFCPSELSTKAFGVCRRYSEGAL